VTVVAVGGDHTCSNEAKDQPIWVTEGQQGRNLLSDEEAEAEVGEELLTPKLEEEAEEVASMSSRCVSYSFSLLPSFLT
jgi:hypothetical protein